MSAESEKSSSQRSRRGTQTTYFTEVINEGGIIVNTDGKPNVLTQEQALVHRDINRILKNHISYPDNAQEFVAGLKSLCQDETSFRKALMPTVLQKVNDSLSPSQENTDGTITQESLIRILLTIECLQPEIIEMLMHHINDQACEETENTSWLRILLSPLKYLPFIIDADLLTSKLLDIVEAAQFTSQLEIINLIPDIIPDSQHVKTAKALSRLMEKNSKLTGAIIDCLNCLELNNDTRAELQDYVLSLLTLNPSPNIFPILFEFLINDCSTQSLQNVLVKARSALDIIMSSDSSRKETESNKLLIYNHLRSLMLNTKTLRESLVRIISNIKIHTDHKPIDIVLLLILYNTSKNNKSALEGLFKKRIKAGLFRTSLLEKVFETYLVPQVLKEYLDSILELTTSLLRQQKDAALYNFASAIYELSFNNLNINRVQRQDILNSLILLAGTSGQKHISSVLDILTSLSQNYQKMQEHVLQLMGLLELLDLLELKEVAKMFDILCGLVCSEKADHSLSGFKDEIHMLIRKLLSSTKKHVKHQGIVSAVMMVKHIAITSAEQSEASISKHDDSPLNISDLPGGIPQEAATLLKLANTSTRNNSDHLGLFYDYLASLLSSVTNLEKHFLVWLFELMTNNFRNIFITDEVSGPINDITLSMQYSLNEADEMDTPIAVNIAELTLKSYEDVNSILILSPLFRLVRLLHYQQHDGDLSSVNALLGCAVVMPVVNDINSYDSHQVKQIANCLLHCINWFREVVSAFITQKSKKLRYRILERLNNLIELEKKLYECLQIVPDHTLPISYFDLVEQNRKVTPKQKPDKNDHERPKKRQKTETQTVNFNDTTVTSVVTQATKSSKNKSVNVQINFEMNFREMDTDIILLLKYPLKLQQLDCASQIVPSQLYLTIKQFIFLLKDVVRKLNMFTSQKGTGPSHMTVSVEDFINDCVRLLPNIMKNFYIVTDAISKIMKENHSLIDSANIFTSETQDLRLAFGIVLEIISLLLNWSGFQHAKHTNLLNDCLKALHANSPSSDDTLIYEVSKKIINFSSECLDLSSAVHIIHILQALRLINPTKVSKKRIAATSEKLLQRKWFTITGNREVGKTANLNIEIIVKAYLDGADVRTLCGLVGTVQEEAAELRKKEDCLRMLESIDKMNFHILYRCLCNSLLDAVSTEVASLTNNEHLMLWRNTALTMQGLMTIVKIQKYTSSLVNFLKKSIAILKVFLSHGIPILEIMLRTKPEEVVEIFKIIQTTTRFLHHLCCISKFTKDISLVAYVPQFRLTLESLLVRVKAALVANNCSSAFWMGTLRNRNLEGEDIASQCSVTSDETNIDADNDQLPPEDSEEEAEHNSNIDDSRSDIF